MTFWTGLLVFVLGFACACLVVGCASGPSTNGYVENTFNPALSEAHKVPTVAEGSAAEAQAIDAWQSLLANLTSVEALGQTSEVYAEQTYFNDTLKTLRTASDVEEHLIATAELLDSGTVVFRPWMRDENGDYFLRWEMSYAGSKLNGGKPIVTIGMSQLRFNEAGKVIFHQDYWDSTSGVFEHIPFVGGQVRFIRNRM